MLQFAIYQLNFDILRIDCAENYIIWTCCILHHAFPIKCGKSKLLKKVVWKSLSQSGVIPLRKIDRDFTDESSSQYIRIKLTYCKVFAGRSLMILPFKFLLRFFTSSHASESHQKISTACAEKRYLGQEELILL